MSKIITMQPGELVYARRPEIYLYKIAEFGPGDIFVSRKRFFGILNERVSYLEDTSFPQAWDVKNLGSPKYEQMLKVYIDLCFEEWINSQSKEKIVAKGFVGLFMSEITPNLPKDFGVDNNEEQG